MWPRAFRRDSERKDLGAPDYAGHSQPDRVRRFPIAWGPETSSRS